MGLARIMWYPSKSKIGKKPHSGLPGVPTSLDGCPLGFAMSQPLIVDSFKCCYYIALPYLDDTCVHSRTLAEHFTALQTVLQAFRKAGLKLQPKKCFLFKSKVEYLGHMVSKEGIGPVPKYTQVIRDWPVPETRGQVRTLLGKCGYYQRFVEHYSQLAKPLVDLIGGVKKGDPEVSETAPLVLTSAAKELFKFMRGALLLRAPILAHTQFHSDQPFIVDTDWSKNQNTIGACLSQIQDGKERVICYEAKKLSKSQANYSSNKGADSESVLGIHPPEYPPSLNSLGQEMHALGNRILTAAATKKLYLPVKSKILMAQQNANILVQVRGWMRTRKPPDRLVCLSLSPETQLYADIFDDLFLDSDDILCQVTDPAAHSIPVSHRIRIPSDLQAMILEATHVTGGHMAAQKTLVRVNITCYFPGMKRIVAEFVLRCRSCQSKSNKMDPQQTGTLASVQAGFPFLGISFDFVGPLAATSKGNKYILTVKDCFTRRIEAFPIVAATALETVDILVKEGRNTLAFVAAT
jgi:hypothetical protein